MTLHECHFFAVRNVQTVLACEGGFGKTQQIDRIQDIRLALSVEADEAVEFGGKIQTRFAYVAII